MRETLKKVLRGLLIVLSWFMGQWDKADVALLVGLGLLFWGIYQVWVPGAYIVSGLVILSVVYIGLLSARTK